VFYTYALRGKCLQRFGVIGAWTAAATPDGTSRRRREPRREYTAGLFRAACERLRISQSMGRPGSALDNAVIESWHSTLEFELRRIEHYATRAAARAGVAAWIEDYNHHRRHSSLGRVSPVDYERALAGRDAA
jgi:putative transposase